MQGSNTVPKLRASAVDKLVKFKMGKQAGWPWPLTEQHLSGVDKSGHEATAAASV